MKKIDVVLVGFNGYGKFYADFLIQNYAQIEYTFSAVVDPFLSEDDKDKLVGMNIPHFKSLDDFYLRHCADLVIISAPIHLHKPMCEKALKHGSTVLCEKPATARLSDLLEMHELEKKYQKDIFIGFQWSFADPILALKRDLLRGNFGRVISGKAIVLWGRDLGYYKRSTGWAGKIRTKEGDFVYDSVASNATAHYLNNLLFLLGSSMETSSEVAEVRSDCRKANPIETFDTCIINLKTVREQQLLFIASHAADRNIDPVFEIVCETAIISCNFAEACGMLSAGFADGTVKQYGQVNTVEQAHKKITDIIGWLNGSPNAEKPVSTVLTVQPFTEVIDDIFEKADFKPFSRDVIFDKTRGRFYVKGLADELMDIYSKH